MFYIEKVIQKAENYKWPNYTSWLLKLKEVGGNWKLRAQVLSSFGSMYFQELKIGVL